jgi:hypothetical protein
MIPTGRESIPGLLKIKGLQIRALQCGGSGSIKKIAQHIFSTEIMVMYFLRQIKKLA